MPRNPSTPTAAGDANLLEVCDAGQAAAVADAVLDASGTVTVRRKDGSARTFRWA